MCLPSTSPRHSWCSKTSLISNRSRENCFVRIAKKESKSKVPKPVSCHITAHKWGPAYWHFQKPTHHVILCGCRRASLTRTTCVFRADPPWPGTRSQTRCRCGLMDKILWYLIVRTRTDFPIIRLARCFNIHMMYIHTKTVILCFKIIDTVHESHTDCEGTLI